VKISVVIPTRDEAGQIEAAVAAAGAPEVEIIVVDGGSKDGTTEIAVAAGARVMNSAPGRALQLEVGARECRGEVILFLHADTRLPEGWSECVTAALATPGSVGGAFRFRFDRGGERYSLLLGLVEWGAQLRSALLGLPYGDQALFVRKDLLESMGGVPQAPIMEDLDLVKAMKGAGRIVLLDEPATTSARRHRAGGPLRVALRHMVLALGWRLGVDRSRLAAWSRR
jgi:rSAM/selenodomain-associated transferase 2